MTEYIEEVKKCLKAQIEAEKAVRNNPVSWQAFHPPQHTEADKSYYVQSEALEKAEADLWAVTDVAYNSKDPLRKAVWEWRYAKVMARLCTEYINIGNSAKAAALIEMLDKAELEMVRLCGLEDIYRTSMQYLEEAFPNLKVVNITDSN